MEEELERGAMTALHYAAVHTGTYCAVLYPTALKHPYGWYQTDQGPAPSLRQQSTLLDLKRQALVLAVSQLPNSRHPRHQSDHPSTLPKPCDLSPPSAPGLNAPAGLSISSLNHGQDVTRPIITTSLPHDATIPAAAAASVGSGAGQLLSSARRL